MMISYFFFLFLTVIFCFISLCIFTEKIAEQNRANEDKNIHYGYSYALAWTGAILALIAGVAGCLLK